MIQEVKASGIGTSIGFDGQSVTVRRLMSTSVIPLASVASVTTSLGGTSVTVIDSGGTRYQVGVWWGGGRVRDAIVAAKRGGEVTG